MRSIFQSIVRQFHVWTGVAVVVVVVGSAVSVFAARTVANSDASSSRRALQRTAANLTSTVRLAIAREEAFLAGSVAFMNNNDPSTVEPQLHQSSSAVWFLDQFPGIISSGAVTVVLRSNLDTFKSQTLNVPQGVAVTTAVSKVVPAGIRSFYCLSTMSIVIVPSQAPTAGLDYCAGIHGSVSLAMRDSGSGVYVPLVIGKRVFLDVMDPIYHSKSVPSSVQGRRLTFVGWMDMVTDPKLMLAHLLDPYPDVALLLNYHVGSTKVGIDVGTIPNGAKVVVGNLPNGWSTRTFGLVSTASIFNDGDSLSLLAGGIALTVFLAGIIDLLGSGRARAEALVRARTEELRHQALHDALTGLPNRTLILDRMEHMLARSRGREMSCAVLFLDLDGFKAINDTLGHRAGDQLLTAFATRLSGAVREEDSVGRLGGDEFIVILEDATFYSGVETVVDRIFDLFNEPFDLPDGPSGLRLSASIGIATGYRARSEELLRDADVALYQAKAMGKARAVSFDSIVGLASDI